MMSMECEDKPQRLKMHRYFQRHNYIRHTRTVHMHAQRLSVVFVFCLSMFFFFNGSISC